MVQRNGLPNDTKVTGKLEAFQRVCRQHGLALVYLFGSQAANALRMLHGEMVELRDRLADIDIGIVTMGPLPSDARQRLRLYAALYNALSEFFAPYPVDLVLLEEHHSVFQAGALMGTCVFQTTQAFRDRYEMSILRIPASAGRRAALAGRNPVRRKLVLTLCWSRNRLG